MEYVGSQKEKAEGREGREEEGMGERMNTGKRERKLGTGYSVAALSNFLSSLGVRSKDF